MSTTEVVHGGSGISEHIELVVVEGRRPKSPVQVARVAPADPRRKAGDIAKHASTESAARNASEPVETTTPQKLYRETVVGSVATDREQYYVFRGIEATGEQKHHLKNKTLRMRSRPKRIRLPVQASASLSMTGQSHGRLLRPHTKTRSRA